MRPVKLVACFLSFIASMICTGCWDENIIERMGFITAVGMDWKGDSVEETMLVPVVSGPAKDKIDVLATVAMTTREARENLRRASGTVLVAGKNRVVVFGEKSARKGVLPFVDVLSRDPRTSATPYMLVTEGTSYDFLKKASELKTKPPVTQYLEQLVDISFKAGHSPGTRLWELDRNVIDKAYDPTATLVKIDKSVYALGTALFKYDKLVGKLDPDETLMFNWLRGKNVVGRVTFHLPQSKKHIRPYSTISFPSYTHKLDVNLDGPVPYFRWQFVLQARIEEYNGADLHEEANLALLRDQTTALLDDLLARTIKKLQDCGSDALGLGRYYRAQKISDWDEKKWHRLYENAELKADVTQINVQIGATD